MTHNFHGTYWGNDTWRYSCTCGGWSVIKDDSSRKTEDDCVREWRAHRSKALQIEPPPATPDPDGPILGAG